MLDCFCVGEGKIKIVDFSYMLVDFFSFRFRVFLIIYGRWIWRNFIILVNILNGR